MDIVILVGFVGSIVTIGTAVWAVIGWSRKRTALRKAAARVSELSSQARLIRAWSDRVPVPMSVAGVKISGVSAFAMNVQNDSTGPITDVHFYFHIRTTSHGLRYEEHPAVQRLDAGKSHTFVMPLTTTHSHDRFVFDGAQFADETGRVWVLSSRPIDSLHLYWDPEGSLDSIEGRRSAERRAELRRKRRRWHRSSVQAIRDVPSEARGMPIELRTTT